jgi:tripartite-type tricarboxylate transporter receptor subunit TctC
VKPPHRLFLHLAAGVAAAFSSIFFSGHSAWSQAARTIKVVVAVPPASLAYTQATQFVEQISEAFSQVHGPIIEIATRTLADGTMGAEDVLRAAPDGNTVLMTSNVFIINPYVRPVHYDPLTSFEPVCYLARLPEVVVVSSRSHYRTLADLLSAARTSPGDLTMASFGPTGSSHIAVEMLKLAANIDMKYVPYPSQVVAVSALLGADVTSAVFTYVVVAEHLKDGKLRALATASRTRIEPLPDVPAVAESGYRDYEAEVRLWLFAPAKTPKEAVSQLAGWFTAAMQAPEAKAKLVARGLYPVGMCGADFGDYFRKQYIEYGRVIRESGIR